jgi:hypothetical protein
LRIKDIVTALAEPEIDFGWLDSLRLADEGMIAGIPFLPNRFQGEVYPLFEAQVMILHPSRLEVCATP